jgi:glycosidase
MLLYDPAIDDILRAKPTLTITSGGKQIPYPFPSPADWRDHWIYFLLVDRFNNPIHPSNPADYPCDFYQGGNLAGIKAQLPYLQKLGVTAIWISPVLINPQWFDRYWGGYGIFDLMRIEPRFCGDPDAARLDPAVGDKQFRDLVDEAHAHGIYVILDIVLNHTGDLFNYPGAQDSADWKASPYTVSWRNEDGVAQGNWNDIATIPHLSPLAGIWPQELQHNEYFRRQGDGEHSGDISRGDFSRLKELVTEYYDPVRLRYPVRDILIRAYQYLIAKFDLDGYRIDTLQYVEVEFSRVFGNAMREYALSIGKKNFFTFGEVWQDDDEARIAEFIGRNTAKDGQFVGVDAAIDFPMRKRLVSVCKGVEPPSVLADHFNFRQEILRTIVSSHGDASKYYVTFLDNHDLNARFHDPAFPGQTRIALTCLMAMQGISCIYYGEEQGLSGAGDKREYARQALWANAHAFDTGSSDFIFLRQLADIYAAEPALRYGRQYFRPCSGNGIDFGYSPYKGGVLAFSRILNTCEVLVIANTSTTVTSTVQIVVDYNLHDAGKTWEVIFPLDYAGAAPGATTITGNYKTVEITLGAMECVILR